MLNENVQTMTVGHTITNYHPIIKVAVLGQGGVGKSALVVRLITKRFITEYSPTLEAFYPYTISSDNETNSFQILDTAGQEIRESDLLWADAFVIMYSIADRDSFTALAKIKDAIDNVKPFGTSCVIIGNKNDLHHREVTYEEGAEFARDISSLFYEISVAKEIESICEIWKDIYMEVESKRVKRKRSYGSAQFKGMITKMFQSKRDRMKTF